MAATPRQSARPPPPLSQAKERRIGEFSKRDTLMFNGHGTQVAQPYRGMDLQRFLCVAGDKRRGSTPEIRGGACPPAGHAPAVGAERAACGEWPFGASQIVKAGEGRGAKTPGGVTQ